MHRWISLALVVVACGSDDGGAVAPGAPSAGQGGAGQAGAGTGGGGAAQGGNAGQGGGAVCAPGQSVACVGPGACQGGQVCLPDGSGYAPCDCGAGCLRCRGGASPC